MIGIDISVPIIAGTEQAKLLGEAWVRRQAEFKMVVETLVKPAEHMAALSSTLRNTSHTEDSVLQETLKELEFLLSDIDNARDFHTIGAWPILVSMLDKKYGVETRARAAWAIGSAVKNSYDYQLWTLERFQPERISNSSGINETEIGATTTPAVGSDEITTMVALPEPSCLEMLVDIIWESAERLSQTNNVGCRVLGSDAESIGYDHLLRRTLYAVFTSARGNPDVQDALLAIDINEQSFGDVFQTSNSNISSSSSSSILANTSTNSKFVHALEALLVSQPTCAVESLEVPRKVWAFVSDVMDEWEYAKGTLLKSDQLTAEMKVALEALPMIGEKFCNVRWGYNIITSVQRLLLQFPVTALSHLFDDSGPGGSINDHDASIVRAALESVSKVIAFQRSQCFLDVSLLHSDQSVAALLAHIQASSLAEDVHNAAFYDMNSTLTYSDSQY